MNKITYKNLRQKLNFKFQRHFFWKQIAFDFTLLASMFGLFQTSYAIINVFLIPIFMFRQFSILHEAVHGLSHPSSKTNQVIGIISGAFCLTPYAVWKVAHLKHHYWTGNLEQDPTFSIIKSYEQSSSFKKRLIQSTWKSGVPLLAALQHLGFWIYCLKGKKSLENTLSLIVPLTTYIIAFSQLNLINVVICFVGVGLYFRIYEDMIVPQHFGMYSDDDASHHPAAWDQQDITRTWYLAPALEKHVVLNMNYHTEHHLFPDLPWHQLDRAHKLLLQEKENINLVTQNWMQSQRQRPFAEVIVPIPSRKKNAA
ncbi:MAG: fatty acid desaturase [Bdellovibrionota bacterium]